MNSWFILPLMIFCHIVDDYYLQGWLASAKQKKYWQENAPAKMYKNDYLWALIMHGFSWAFMIMLPIAFKLNFAVDINFCMMLIINAVFHASIDDLKANKFRINLWQDQLAHMGQLVVTFILYLLEVF